MWFLYDELEKSYYIVYNDYILFYLTEIGTWPYQVYYYLDESCDTA